MVYRDGAWKIQRDPFQTLKQLLDSLPLIPYELVTKMISKAKKLTFILSLSGPKEKIVAYFLTISKNKVYHH